MEPGASREPILPSREPSRPCSVAAWAPTWLTSPSPRLPALGELAAAIWKQQIGEDLDGVLSMDPGALAEVLGATGPVKRTGEVLTSKNAEKL